MRADVLDRIIFLVSEANRVQDTLPAEAARLRKLANALNDFSEKIKNVRDSQVHRIHSSDMPPPDRSWWRFLLARGSDGAWVRFAGMTKALFDELVLLARGHPEFVDRDDYAGDAYAPPGASGKRKRGGQRVMGGVDAMGLACRYIFGMSETVGLMSSFFVTTTTISDNLALGRKLLLYALRLHPDAEVRWPTLEEQKQFARLIAQNGCNQLPDGLADCFPFIWVDGVCYPTKKTGIPEIDRMMFSGKKHIGPLSSYCAILASPTATARYSKTASSTTPLPATLPSFLPFFADCINNLYAFSPFGLIVWQNLNNPGSYNDTDLCKPLTDILLDAALTIKNFVALADVAFKGEGADRAYLTLASAASHTASAAPGALGALCLWLLSKRNAVEWCMATLQLTFRRLVTRLASDAAERAPLLETISLLHNLRVRHGARTQIGTVYANSCLVGDDAANESSDVAALERKYTSMDPEALDAYAMWFVDADDCDADEGEGVCY